MSISLDARVQASLTMLRMIRDGAVRGEKQMRAAVGDVIVILDESAPVKPVLRVVPTGSADR